ncbi:hypothetical protein NQZ68_003918 [Dissostichus eleginoides]|nr:hypothetical protein NQZ68_003918 [Dissostichus eleginoides]
MHGGPALVSNMKRSGTVAMSSALTNRITVVLNRGGAKVSLFTGVHYSHKQLAGFHLSAGKGLEGR